MLAARMKMKLPEGVMMTINDNAVGRVAISLNGVAGILQGDDRIMIMKTHGRYVGGVKRAIHHEINRRLPYATFRQVPQS
mgnify:CR=1 FL=1